VSNLSVVVLSIKTRVLRDRIPFSEIHYRFREGDGPERYALTRLHYTVTDSPYQRQHEAQQFTKRHSPEWGAQ
jgi:hypothetical protein